MNRNDKLIALPTNMPTTQREWSQFIRVLSEATVRIKDGRIYDGSVLPQSVVGNRGSVQSAVPISAVDAGSDATINIAAHTTSYDFGDVSYSAGTITGLNYSTTYYIYASDPTFAGGSVAYLATTSTATVVGDSGNYYAGAVITPPAAQTGASASASSGTATVTLTAHGHLAGASVVISGANEGDYNGTFTVATAATDSFTHAISATAPVTATGTISVASGGVPGGGGSGGGGGVVPDEGEAWK